MNDKFSINKDLLIDILLSERESRKISEAMKMASWIDTNDWVVDPKTHVGSSVPVRQYTLKIPL